MHLKKITLSLTSLFLLACPYVHASDFDRYLQQENLIDQQFKIKNSDALNDVLHILSVEDSRTLPLQIDQNLVIEKLSLYANKTELEGMIITPDFQQFEQQFGHAEVEKIIHQKLLSSCDIFFEHQYQHKNPYLIQLKLKSSSNQYQLVVKQSDCKIK